MSYLGALGIGLQTCSGSTCYYFHADFLFSSVTQWPYLDLKRCDEVGACQKREIPGMDNTCKVLGRECSKGHIIRH